MINTRFKIFITYGLLALVVTAVAVASTYQTSGCIRRILFAARLPALRAVGITVVLRVSIALGRPGAISSRTGFLFAGRGRTFRAYHPITVATVFVYRRELISCQRNTELSCFHRRMVLLK